jgi:recombination protein RecA
MAIKKKFKIKTEAELQKKYGSGVSASARLKEMGLWLPSSVISVNLATGGGILYGRILELFGQESSGKTMLAQDFAKVTNSLGGVSLWVDAERCYSEAWAKELGIDTENLYLYEDNTIENIADWIRDMVYFHRSRLLNNEPILLVVDSMAALESQQQMQIEFSDAKAEMGNRAKAIYRMLRVLNPVLTDLGVCSIFVNQLRQKVGAGMFEDPDTTPGGSAMKFYASIRLGVYGGKAIKAKIKGVEKKVGRTGSLRVKKNKLAPPADSIKYEMYNNSKYADRPLGFDKYFGLLDTLLEEGVVNKTSKNSPKIYYKETVIANGKDDFDRVLREDTVIRRKLLKELDVNTPSKLRKLLSSLNENFFKVDG